MTKYRAGIWSESGVFAFFWSTDGTYRDTNPCRIKRPQTYVASTWSWASISLEYKVNNENVVRWLMWKTSKLDDRKQLQDHLFEIEDITCTVEGDSPGLSTMYYSERDLDVDGWQPEYDFGETYGLLVTTQGLRIESGVVLILQKVSEKKGNVDVDNTFRRIGITDTGTYC
ncbi:uncharacterized protein EAE97_005780 [Botrytis byssoidea]|uniref:Uncharacterized protein n=1 Tax=Botrytis byssoidea TaxID=139641 RepID=A0A9P5IJF1_9HELO|nr:uncharacterized protein EAE97_005780 [Botrytis byssoidea]KAF7943710.1 hypothetical protein EAE97_005780 [Botrytis byssoidea]